MGKKEWLREIYRRRDRRRAMESRMNRGETCRWPQRRIRLTNYLLLHYKGCQPGCLCQLSYTLMPVSVTHTPHTHTTYRHNRAHAPYQRMHTACTCLAAFSKVYTHTCMRTRTLYLLLTDDKGACHHSDSDWCCSNVTATPECVRQK